jgi:uncharacterized membrane protein YtjA (UPF0391 family)
LLCDVVAAVSAASLFFAPDTGTPTSATRSGLPRCDYVTKEVIEMLKWAVIFLIIALVAGLLGFTGLASAAAGIAKFLFVLFLILCVVFFIMGMVAAKKITGG